MDTLLTEIIGFIRNCEGVSGWQGGNAAAGFILAWFGVAPFQLHNLS
jgi:hypothetical protein